MDQPRPFHIISFVLALDTVCFSPFAATKRTDPHRRVGFACVYPAKDRNHRRWLPAYMYFFLNFLTSIYASTQAELPRGRWTPIPYNAGVCVAEGPSMAPQSRPSLRTQHQSMHRQYSAESTSLYNMHWYFKYQFIFYSLLCCCTVVLL